MSGPAHTLTGNQHVAEGCRSDEPSFLGRITVESGSEHACRARFDGLDVIQIVTQAPGQIHDSAVCYFDVIGALPGRIGATNTAGFELHPVLSAERRARISVRLAWHTARAAWTAEQRAEPRVVPECGGVTVRLTDGLSVPALILDLSRTGAKIKLSREAEIAVGSAVTVGKRYATIVRVEGSVIAVRFRLPFSDQTFSPSVLL